MKKGTLIGTIIFVVIGAMWYLLLTNSHMDFFPGKETVYDYFTKTESVQERSVSLMYVVDGRAELTVTGYLMAILVVLGVPGLPAWLVARRVNKKQAAKQEAVTTEA